MTTRRPFSNVVRKAGEMLNGTGGSGAGADRLLAAFIKFLTAYLSFFPPAAVCGELSFAAGDDIEQRPVIGIQIGLHGRSDLIGSYGHQDIQLHVEQVRIAVIQGKLTDLLGAVL